MKRYDIYCALFWILLALFEVCLSMKLSPGTLKYPGPGFFPIIIGAFLLFFSLLLIIMVARGEKPSDYYTIPPFPGKVWLICALMFGYSFLLEYLGYIISTALLLFYLFKYPASKKWGPALLMSAVVVILTYYFFGVLLDAQFPKGILKIR
jgi:putative tricarboxylic transport membrane protein